MKCYKDIFENYLISKNLKFTSQRRAILNAAFDLHKHFTVESLYDYLKNTDSANPVVLDVSMTTIYRTIPMLIDSGLVKVAGNINGKESFEHTFGHPFHIHITCISCGYFVETEDTTILFRTLKKITDQYDFKITDFSLSVKGKCHECRKKK